MSEQNDKKQYAAYKLPPAEPSRKEAPDEAAAQIAFGDNGFYEIEYDLSPFKGVGKFVRKPQAVAKQEADPIRERFNQMRDIARANKSRYDFSRFDLSDMFSQNAVIFYKQAVFMQDFTDAYNSAVPLTAYYPSYQMMGYQQLRTYFTWRTKVRAGQISNISEAYASIYLYELINNVGVESPEDGLDKLMFFWKAYRQFDPLLDLSIRTWLIDYHICYPLAQPFTDFIRQHGLADQYARYVDQEDDFNAFTRIASYQILKSNYFKQNESLVKECFYYVLTYVRDLFKQNDLDFDDQIFTFSRNLYTYVPFSNALFYQDLNMPDRIVPFSRYETYYRRSGNWMKRNAKVDEHSKQLVGFILKQMEITLRNLTHYKYKLTADTSKLTHPIFKAMHLTGLGMASLISAATIAFYREKNKTVIKVDPKALDAIRQEALITQEKLIVPEEEKPVPVFVPPKPTLATPPANNGFASLRQALSDVERNVLSMLYRGDTGIKAYADACGIMLEVLIDGINEKAMDAIGDNLIDEALELYDDYIDNVKEWING